MTNINDLDLLKETDIYSMALFILYKFMEVPEYSSLCELPYILDKENLLKLCQYFGGQTIKIPTVLEFKGILNAILLYWYVKICKVPYMDALKKLGYEDTQYKTVKKIYTKLCEVLGTYDFKSRKTD